jgi:hypothetical protein
MTAPNPVFTHPDDLRQIIEDAYVMWFNDGKATSLLSDQILTNLAAAGYEIAKVSQ